MNIRVEGDTKLIFEFERITKEMEAELRVSLKQIGSHLEKEIKDKFGTYQRNWPKLKRETVVAKYRKRALRSFSRPNINSGSIAIGKDDPLILFGKLKDGVKHEVNNQALEAVVYNNVEYAAVHEYGYKNVPARSYMRLTLWDEEDKILDILNKNIKKVL